MTTGNAAAISSALAAASIATAYATAYLATKTYGLVPSGAGFIVTIGVSILALAIALAFGEGVALVGIVGGYVAPIVYGGGPANAAFLAIYITLLTAVTFAIIRLKSWWRLSVVGLLGPAFYASRVVCRPASSAARPGGPMSCCSRRRSLYSSPRGPAGARTGRCWASAASPER